MSMMPLTSSGYSFFKETSTPEPNQQINEAEVLRVTAALASNGQERKTCRWCLRMFDPERQQVRTVGERGYLRSNLKIADNGTELVCCDDCWQGAVGARIMMGSQIVPCSDYEKVPNMLLAESLKDSTT